MSSLWRKEFAIVIQKNSPENSNSMITFNLKIARFITDKCFHMTSLPSYWCPKTWNDGHVGVTNQSCMVGIISLRKNVLFSKIHLRGCWLREWKGSNTTFTKTAMRKQSLVSFISVLLYTLKLVEIVICSNFLLYFYRPGTTPRAITLLRHF